MNPNFDLNPSYNMTTQHIETNVFLPYVAILNKCFYKCFPNLFIGNYIVTKDKEYLKRIGITHVVNTIQRRSYDTMDREAGYYANVGIQYKGISCLDDHPDVIFNDYIHDTSNYIDEALNNGGKVLVYCLQEQN